MNDKLKYYKAQLELAIKKKCKNDIELFTQLIHKYTIKEK